VFKTQDKIPNEPHLIVVPTSLMEQWIREIKVFFHRKNIEFYQLPGTETEIENFFLNPGNPWANSLTPMPFCILLITQSVS